MEEILVPEVSIPRRPRPGTTALVTMGGVLTSIDANGNAAPVMASAAQTLLTPSTDLALDPPTGTFAIGGRAKFHITPTVDCTLTLMGIAIPSDSSFTSRSIPAGKLCIVQLEYSGAFWMLTSIVGNYAAP